MSRVGKQKITVPQSVALNIDGRVVSVKGPKGELVLSLPPTLEVRVEADGAFVERKKEDRASRALHGLNRMLLANMVEGVSNGYSKTLTIEGVGYKASMEQEQAVFALGFSAPKRLNIPAGIELKINDGVEVVVSGVDKQLVGDFAARIRALHPVEPYKGKGIRYKGEHVRRKVGKTVA